MPHRRRWQTREEGDQPHDQDGPERVGKAVVQRDGAADGLQRQKGHAAKAVLATRSSLHLRALWGV